MRVEGLEMFTGKHGSDGRRYVGGTLALEDANVDPLRRFRDFEDLGFWCGYELFTHSYPLRRRG